MLTIESIKKDIPSLGYEQKVGILSYLEEVITFGAVSMENTKKSRNPDSPRDQVFRQLSVLV